MDHERVNISQSGMSCGVMEVDHIPFKGWYVTKRIARLKKAGT